MKKFLIIPLLFPLFIISQTSSAAVKINVSAKLSPTIWSGSNNKPNEKDFEENANQWSFGVSFQRAKLYGGLSLHIAEFDFGSPAPDKVTATNSSSSSNVTIEHAETDLTLGYYFWPTISLFIDIKNIGNNWQGESYDYAYNGVGMGVSAFRPINARWTLVGSLGFVPKLTIKDSNGGKLGDGNGSALDIGFLYHVAEKTNLSVGLKSQTNTLNFDSGDKQDHKRGGLYVGIAHQF